MKDQILVLKDDFETPHKDLSFSAAVDFLPSLHKAKEKLRISTSPRTDLHDRYLSDEEELSPSLEDSAEESLEGNNRDCNDSLEEDNDDEMEYTAIFDCSAEIAVAVPIMAIGPPRLVDITNIAPMQKRKRASQVKEPFSSFRSSLSRLAPIADENDLPDEHQPIQDSHSTRAVEDATVISTAPGSWLPDQAAEGLDAEDHPSPNRLLAFTYNERDPYNLKPPRLRTSPPRKRVTRMQDHPPHSVRNSLAWKGFARSLSIAKRPDPQYARPQRAKKASFTARGAREVDPTLKLPPFPFENAASA